MASLSDTHEALQQGRGSVAEREPGQGRTSSKENEGRSTSSQQAQHDQRQRRGLSGPRASGTGTGTGRPALRPRWFHARGKGWAAFEKKDDEELERVWKALGGQEWAEGRRVGRERKEEEKDGKEASEQAEGEGEGEGNGGDEDEQEEEEEPAQLSTSSSMEAVKNALGEWLPSSITSRKEGGADGSEEMGEKEKSEKDGKGKGKGKEGEEEKEKKKKMESRVVHQALDPDEPPENRRAKVPVLEDRLFEVDLEQMELYPVFWKGVLLRVVRATWFYSSSTDGSYAPIAYDEGLARDLDAAYERVQPWREEYKKGVEKQFRGEQGEKEQERKKEKGKDKDEEVGEVLPSLDTPSRIVFEDGVRGRIYGNDITGRLLSVVGGSLVVRGFEEAERLARAKKGGLISLGGMQLPWASGKEDGDSDGESTEGPDEQRKKQGDTRGARRGARKEGAAELGGQPQTGGGADGSSGDAGAEDGRDGAGEDESFATRLWPKSGSWLRPRVGWLRTLGMSKDDAEEEEQRATKEKTTQEAMKNEGEAKQDAPEAGDEDDPIDGEEQTPGEGGKEEEDLSDEPPELVLCIHGIGQKLSEVWDALDFVYDVERFRNLSQKQAQDPTMRKISKGRRAQFLPICWRTALSFDEQPEKSDNHYTLEDISNDASIPVVRTVISKVVLDVPYYLSHHREKMINAVRKELNRVYRLFVQRNPEFENRGGRVSLVCHSLGSALATDILSAQPTHVPPLAELSEEERKTHKRLVFNTKCVFFIGSPVGFFLYLDSAQLIARRGTARTKDVEEDAASDEVGRYGCMAAESIFNVYNTTDPVAYQLSATVDAPYSSMVKPIPIPAAVASLLEALSMPRLSLSKFFAGFDRPFDGVGQDNRDVPAPRIRPPRAGDRKASQKDKKEGKDRKEDEGPSEMVRKLEHSKVKDRLTVESGDARKKMQARRQVERANGKFPKGAMDFERLEKAERRFRALNPHGCIDFTISSDGINEYLDMISAHISYWTSAHFSTFVLTQLFADLTDRTTPTVVPEMAPPNEAGNERAQEEDEESRSNAE